MADELVRRREIRRRKVLESSEDRLKKITSSHIKESKADVFDCGDNSEADKILKTPEVNIDGDVYSSVCGMKIKREEDVSLIGESNNPNETQRNENTVRRSRFENDSRYLLSTNGDFARCSSSESYTFPKKVSDAETRSFGRTRSDVRRNSTCKQLVMETLQFSSFSLTDLRFGLLSFAAFVVKMCFLLLEDLPIFQTIFFPFLMLEVAIFSLSKLEAQAPSRPVSSTIVSSILLLCGFSSIVISGFNYVSNIVYATLQDFCVYVFSFVFLHFIFEMSI